MQAIPAKRMREILLLNLGALYHAHTHLQLCTAVLVPVLLNLALVPKVVELSGYGSAHPALFLQKIRVPRYNMRKSQEKSRFKAPNIVLLQSTKKYNVRNPQKKSHCKAPVPRYGSYLARGSNLPTFYRLACALRTKFSTSRY